MTESSASAGAGGQRDDPGALVFTCDADGAVREWDDRVPAATGTDPADLAGTPLSSLGDSDALDALIGSAIETGSASSVCALGREAGTDYDVTATRVGDGGTAAVVVRATRAGGGSRVAALRERERALRRVYEVTADRGRSFDEQVGTLLAVGCEVLDVAYGTLSRIRGDDYLFERVHAPPDAPFAEGDVVPVSYTSCERVASSEETLVLSNMPEQAPDIAARDGNAETGIACYLGAPVYVEDDVYGTFCFYDIGVRDRAFDDWEVTFVDLMAQWVSYERTSQHVHDQLARRNDQLEEFASVVSHDLRSPLGVVEGSLELAEETGDAEHFERCRQALERMETLVEDLLSLARAGELADDTDPLDLAAVAQNCWATTATPDVTLAVETDRSVVADETRLRQLLENLFRNAVEHGGTTVTVGALDDGFYVADDGPGIPEAHREQVLEAGYSSADDGTGFGLYIVEQVATAHGWDVAVAESETGGARFEFTNVAGAAT